MGKQKEKQLKQPLWRNITIQKTGDLNVFQVPERQNAWNLSDIGKRNNIKRKV